MQSILAIDVTSALLAILPLLFVTVPQPVRTETVGRSTVLADMDAGLRFVRSWKGLLMFSGIGTLSNVMGRAAVSMMLLLVVEHFSGERWNWVGSKLLRGPAGFWVVSR